MPSGCEGALTLTIGMKVSPEPDSHQELLDLMKRYRDALNYSIRVIIENKALSLSKAHKLLYNVLREKFGFPSRIAIDCYRNAITIAKSWLKNPDKGKIPTAKKPCIWLTANYSYRIRDGCVELIGGFKLRIIGWDKRYDSYPNREARLIFRNGEFFLMVSKQIPKPEKYAPKGVLAIDVNEREIVIGNSHSEQRLKTPIERALHYRLLAENLQKKYSSLGYNAWFRRKGIRKRIRHFYRKARNIIDDWAKQISHKVVVLARQNQYAVGREDLTGLIENLRKLPRDHRVALLILSYRKLAFWIDWQCKKHGIPHKAVEAKGTSSICPQCNSKLKENGYRMLKCSKCGFEADRDVVAVINIEKKALLEMGCPLTAPDCSPDDRCKPE
jgi:putative transposase